MNSPKNTTLRYLRHIDLPQLGFEGQEKIMAGCTALVGMGGLGAPAALYLAGAGVGRLILIDHDHVEESNLQRQIIYTMADVGKPKAEAAREKLLQLNPNIRVDAHVTKLDATNATTLLHGADCILDCSDNFETRHLLNDYCVSNHKTLVTAAVQGFAGMWGTFAPHKGAAHACARCLFSEAPPEGMVPTCPEAGVFGPIVGLMGVAQAGEALKELAGLNAENGSFICRFDSLSLKNERLGVPVDPACKSCGTRGMAPLQSAAS
jgi:molybdopterin/thiamine biosynthesis adenylyltransferase